MNKLSLSILIIGAIIIAYMEYHYTKEINDINKRYVQEMDLYKKKYESKLNDIQNKYREIDKLYKDREDINEKYVLTKDKLKEDSSRLESLLIKKPVLIENKINNSINKLMEDIYEETRINSR